MKRREKAPSKVWLVPVEFLAYPALPGDLVATLKTPEGSRFSELERL
jgi:hypothetical protein